MGRFCNLSGGASGGVDTCSTCNGAGQVQAVQVSCEDLLTLLTIQFGGQGIVAKNRRIVHRYDVYFDLISDQFSWRSTAGTSPAAGVDGERTPRGQRRRRQPWERQDRFSWICSKAIANRS